MPTYTLRRKLEGVSSKTESHNLLFAAYMCKVVWRLSEVRIVRRWEADLDGEITQTLDR